MYAILRSNHPHRLALWSLPLVFLCLLVSMHVFALPKITEKISTVLPEEYSESFTILPSREKQPSRQRYTLQIEYAPQQQTVFKIHPRGCVQSVELNDQKIRYNKRTRCNSLLGMQVDLTDALQPGTNTLDIETNESVIHIGPVIFNPDKWQLTDTLGCAMIAVACAWLILFLARFTGEYGSGALMAAALIAYVNRFSIMAPGEYAMDLAGHLDYITFIAMNDALPRPYSCFSCYHAPLYYVLQGMLLQWVNWLGSFDGLSALRAFSFTCFITFCVYSILCIRKLIKHQLAYYVSLLLFLLYPFSIFSASRIDSHLLFYALYAACAYHALCWIESSRQKHLVISIIFIGIAIATRSNALILLPLLGIAALYMLWQKKTSLPALLLSRAVWAAIVVLLLGTTINLGRTYYYRAIENRADNMLIGTSLPRQYFGIANTPETLFTLHLRGYLELPYYLPFSRPPERDYFLNAVMKTSLFGEFRWPRPFHAKNLSYLLLGVVFFWLAGTLLAFSQLKRSREWWIAFCAFFIPMGSVIALRLYLPLFCHHDFRFIYPALAGFCALYGLLIENQLKNRRHVWAGIGMVLAVLFCLQSVLFYL